jgi:hypothetical protein
MSQTMDSHPYAVRNVVIDTCDRCQLIVDFVNLKLARHRPQAVTLRQSKLAGYKRGRIIIVGTQPMAPDTPGLWSCAGCLTSFLRSLGTALQMTIAVSD